MLYNYDPIFYTNFLHCFGLIIYKSGYATETFVKELDGCGGVLHFKGISLYSHAPLDLRASDKIYETAHQKLHHLFVLPDLFCGLRSSRE